jgi:hypothetical protein
VVDEFGLFGAKLVDAVARESGERVVEDAAGSSNTRPSGVVPRRPAETRNGCFVARYFSRGITDENLCGLDTRRRARRHSGRRP